MQVDPIKPKLRAPESNRLKLKCDVFLLNFGFKFNLRRYTTVYQREYVWHAGRGLHSLTFQLNLSRV